VRDDFGRYGAAVRADDAVNLTAITDVHDRWQARNVVLGRNVRKDVDVCFNDKDVREAVGNVRERGAQCAARTTPRREEVDHDEVAGTLHGCLKDVGLRDFNEWHGWSSANLEKYFDIALSK